MSKLVFELRPMTIAATVAAFIVAVAAAVAAAPGGHTTEGAHFNSATGSVNADGALVVTWDEAGVGDNAFIDYSLTADASATYACINGGGNHPKAANKESVNATTTTDFTAEAKNGTLTTSIADRGPGIDDFEQSLVFEKFYRGRNQRVQVHGAGMGLAICRSIIEAHGGKLWAIANEDRRATFQFTLPPGGVKA